MIHFISILLICSIYVATYILQKGLYLRDDLFIRMILFIKNTSWINKIIIFTLGLSTFILLSPINFLLILFIQIKHYGKD
jgi:hypothetical protein